MVPPTDELEAKDEAEPSSGAVPVPLLLIDQVIGQPEVIQALGIKSGNFGNKSYLVSYCFFRHYSL
jgi:hypothetical protein